MAEKEKNREDQGAKHQHSLNKIGPHDRLDSANRRVNRSDDCDENDAPHIGVQINRQRREEITPDDHHDRAAEIKANPDPEHAGEEEDPARHVLGLGPEADGQELIDALHPIVVVRFDESGGDDKPPQDRADDQLAVEIAPRLEIPQRGSKKSRCACLCRNDGRQDRPPWN